MSAYRANPTTPKPMIALVVRGNRALAVAFFMTLLAFVPVLFMAFVSITCTREGSGDDGTCHVSERGPFVWRARDYPLRDIVALRAEEYVDSDHDTLSKLVLVTTHGDVSLGTGSDNIDVGARRKAATGFTEFREGRASRFHVTVGFGSVGFSIAWVAVCALVVFGSQGRTLRVVIDPARGAVRVRRWFRTIDLPLSRDLQIVCEQDSESSERWMLVTPARKIELPKNVRPEDVATLRDALDAALGDAS